MEKIKSEGIVVHALPYRDYDSIITLFTLDEGLIKTYCHGAYGSKKGKGGITTPLTTVDVVYSKGRSDLYSCHEISALNHHLALRQNLPTLDAACDMLKAVSATQQPGKAAPELYTLLLTYLQRLPAALVPAAAAGSFRLKLLRYEGLLGQLSHCCECADELQGAWVSDHDAYCRPHAPPGALDLEPQERSAIELLAFSRDFAQLGAVIVSPALAAKIHELFKTNSDF